MTEDIVLQRELHYSNLTNEDRQVVKSMIRNLNCKKADKPLLNKKDIDMIYEVFYLRTPYPDSPARMITLTFKDKCQS